ncbi:hypothetical protein P3339_17725 [Microbulbifer sp. MLAF003]|uniref:hypothetical protein n=1 Tax=Microbulbifer sp. MLAF003 TaxID=3032582 RepID=UPI0024ADAA5A|nr:hypothetical protein [Microbulbifer sp. MLAF003]WHI50269.1 hypothetical protein P3339_17725 [Microbulbifer sp. MLAF003]
MSKGAMTIAEGSQASKYKTDATLILNGIQERQYVLRTAFDSLSVWKTKYAVNVSPFYPRLKTSIKEAALIDNEIWVFGIDGTNPHHIIDAVTVASQFYMIEPRDILSNVYVKNLNTEGEASLELSLLVKLNKDLYRATTEAIMEACRHFGINNEVNLHVYSANINPKIPQQDLHQALKDGGASSVVTDSRNLKYKSGNNLGNRGATIRTNMHVAKLEF